MQRKEGKPYGHALRALANIILKIAFAMLKNHTTYDEARFLSAKEIKPHHFDYTTREDSHQIYEISRIVDSLSSVTGARINNPIVT